MAEKPDSARELVSEHYRGHDIDFDTAVDRMEIMQDGAKDSPHTKGEVDDTEVEIGPKEQENPNDPYCTC